MDGFHGTKRGTVVKRHKQRHPVLLMQLEKGKRRCRSVHTSGETSGLGLHQPVLAIRATMPYKDQEIAMALKDHGVC